jgi:hypothetical protein
MIYLQKTNQKAAGEFLNGPLWADFKRCLLDRRPPTPDAKEPSHTAAARGHQRAGFEAAIEAMERIPFEFPEEQRSPFARPAVAITED